MFKKSFIRSVKSALKNRKIFNKKKKEKKNISLVRNKIVACAYFRQIIGPLLLRRLFS